MKKQSTLILSVIYFLSRLFLLGIIYNLQSEISYAQTNLANTQKSVPYKANYQHMETDADHTLEIRDGTLWALGDNPYGQLWENQDKLITFILILNIFAFANLLRTNIYNPK